MASLRVSNILACTPSGGYAFNGDLPWLAKGIPVQPWARSDMSRFSAVTRRPGSAVVMGRKTWESLSHKPLQGRLNVVISRSATCQFTEGGEVSWVKTDHQTVWVNSLEAALAVCRSENTPNVWIIGGESLWTAARELPEYVGSDVLITPGEFQFDQRTSLAEGLLRGNPQEDAYLKLMQDIIDRGIVQPNRTGVNTRVLLNQTLVFDLTRDGVPIIPLLTSKTCLLKNICVELASFLRADDNTEYMRERGCNIWDGNSTREFLDSRGLRDYAVGQLGPIYGCQWRKWNADWTPTGGFGSEGLDQIADLIARAKRDPTDRRLVVSAWNPGKVPQMALPPCHMFFQVNILGGQAGPQTAQITGGQLHMTFYMRSADIALGVPYNIASYAILSHLLAREIGVQPGTVTCIMSNCHIYENHVELAREQTARPTFAFPTLDMRAKNIDEFINLSYEENINVNNYVHGAFIPYKMN